MSTLPPQLQMELILGAENAFFGVQHIASLYIKRSFCQDRLGTNILGVGKVPLVCPEPVLVKCSISYINGSKRPFKHTMNLELGLSKKEAFFCRTGFRSLLAIVAYEPRRRQENDQIFCDMFMLKLIMLPQQAWGRHKESTQKRDAFSCRHQASHVGSAPVLAKSLHPDICAALRVPAPGNISVKTAELRLSGSAGKSQKRFRDTPRFKFRAVFARIQPFLSRNVERMGRPGSV